MSSYNVTLDQSAAAKKSYFPKCSNNNQLVLSWCFTLNRDVPVLAYLLFWEAQSWRVLPFSIIWRLEPHELCRFPGRRFEWQWDDSRSGFLKFFLRITHKAVLMKRTKENKNSIYTNDSCHKNVLDQTVNWLRARAPGQLEFVSSCVRLDLYSLNKSSSSRAGEYYSVVYFLLRLKSLTTVLMLEATLYCPCVLLVIRTLCVYALYLHSR